MKNLNVKGTLQEKGAIQQYGNSDNPFVKQEIILFIDGEQHNYYKFEFVADNVKKLEAFNVGDFVEITFNINGRRWEKEQKVSYFNSLVGWRIKKAS